MIKFSIGLGIIILAIFLGRKSNLSSYSDLDKLEGLGASWTYYLPHFLVILSIGLLLFSLTQPTIGFIEHEKKLRGLEIILTMDFSSSMNGVIMRGGDEKWKLILKSCKAFVKSREGTEDRIGIVAYSTHAYVMCPLTYEKEIVGRFIEAQKENPLSNQTGIGRALQVSIAELTEFNLEEVRNNPDISKKRKGKIIILFSDGRHNTGINPQKVLPLAKKLGIKVYFVRAGKNPKSGVQRLVSETGGESVSVANTKKAKEIFLEISKNEKAMMVEEEKRISREVTTYYIGFALLFFILAIVIREVFFPIP